MTKNVIKKLAEISFVDNALDEKKVIKVSRLLKKTDLKLYLKSLKTMELKNTVTIYTPSKEGVTEMKKYFSRIYPNKKLIFSIDESLIGGVKVIDYDNEYELTLKGFLEKAVRDTND